MPILVLVDPVLVPVPLIVASLALNLGTSYRYRGGIDARVRWALLGSVPGTVLGAYAIATIPQRPLAITFGVLVLAAVVVSVCGLQIAPTTAGLLAAGAISGFTGTASSSGLHRLRDRPHRQPAPALRGGGAGADGGRAGAGRAGVRAQAVAVRPPSTTSELPWT